EDEFIDNVTTTPRLLLRPREVGLVVTAFPILGGGAACIVLHVEGMTVRVCERNGVWVAERLVVPATGGAGKPRAGFFFFARCVDSETGRRQAVALVHCLPGTGLCSREFVSKLSARVSFLCLSLSVRWCAFGEIAVDASSAAAR